MPVSGSIDVDGGLDLPKIDVRAEARDLMSAVTAGACLLVGYADWGVASIDGIHDIRHVPIVTHAEGFNRKECWL